MVIEAKRNGYYEYPRKSSEGELARKFGLNKSTTVEHLRKAENRMLDQILAGH